MVLAVGEDEGDWLPTMSRAQTRRKKMFPSACCISLRFPRAIFTYSIIMLLLLLDQYSIERVTFD